MLKEMTLYGEVDKEAMVSKTYSVNPRIEVCLQEIPTSI